MARIKRPVKGSRVLVKLPQITRKKPGTTTQLPIIVKMKVSHVKLLGLTQLKANDPLFFGTFPTTGNGFAKGAKYVKNIGGFRTKSFRFVGEKLWKLTEETEDAQGQDKTQEVELRTISIGFPGGVSFYEVLNWVNAQSATFKSNLAFIITPAGRRFAYVDGGETNIGNDGT